MELQDAKIIFRVPPIRLLFQWFPALFYLANLYMRTGHSSTVYLSILYLAGGTGLLVLLLKKDLRKDALYITFFVYLITGLINYLAIDNVSLSGIVNDALLLGVLVMMIAYPMGLFEGTVFYCISAAVFIIAYFTGVKVHLLLTSSGNYISVLMLLATALYYISFQNSGKRFRLIHVLPALICFLLSIWARGRGGILACTVLIILVGTYYLFNYIRFGSDIRFVLVAFAVIIAAVVIYYNNVDLFDKFMSLGKWSYKGTDNTAREEIWKAYFDKGKENFIYVLLGVPVRKVNILNSYNSNTHNSFIQLHATNGLIAVVMFAVFSVRSLIYYVKKKQYLMFAVFVSIIVRGMTDKFIFGQYGLPIVMYFVLYPYYENYIISVSRTAQE